MHKRLIALLFIAVMLSGGIPVSASEQEVMELYVSPCGNEFGRGTLKSPVGSVNQALELAKEVRASKPEVQIIINLRGGQYPMTEGIRIDSKDAGVSSQKPLIIRNYQNEVPVLKGSQTLEPSKFRQVTDEKVLARIPENARAHVGELDLRQFGIKQIDKYPYAYGFNVGSDSVAYHNLFVNGREQQIARFPNHGWAEITEGIDKFTFKYHGAEPQRWMKAEDAMLEGYFGTSYSYERTALESVNDDILHAYKAWYGYKTGNRWAAFNLLEELDSPGEWFIDRTQMKLYYYPPYTLSNVTMELAMLDQPMLTIQNADYIRLEGLVFDTTRDNGIVVSESSHIVIDRCSLNHIGRQGIYMTGGAENVVSNCNIFHIGAVGIYVNAGDRQTLKPAGYHVVGNHLYDTATKSKTYHPAISINGVGNVVENNLIHESPHQGIFFSGNDHIFRYNEIYNVLKETADSGAIYCGRDYTMRGNEVAYNYIHDIETTAKVGGSQYAVGVYLDDMFSSVNIHHNVFQNVHLCTMIGGGHYNRFDYNIMVNCPNTLYLDNRGEGWAIKHTKPGGEAYEKIFEVPYNRPPYSEKYPELCHIFDRTLGLPIGNTTVGNLMYRCGEKVVADHYKEYGVYKNNQDIDRDPGFINPEGGNFGLKEDANILQTIPELSKINMDKIGLPPERAAAETERYQSNEFKQYAPRNGEININNQGYWFQWDSVENADEYEVTIATDPELKNVVRTERTKSNYINMIGLQTGSRAFYWKVKAKNVSYQSPKTWESLGKPYLFVTSARDVLEKTRLEELYQLLDRLCRVIKEGTQPGTYRIGYKAKVQQTLDDVQAICVSNKVSQREVDAAVERLQEQIDAVTENINYQTVDAGAFLFDQKNWHTNGNLTFSGKEATLVKEGGNYAGYIVPHGDYDVLRFGLKTTVGSNYMGISFNQTDPEQVIFQNKKDAYLLVIKNNLLEMQRWTGGKQVIIETAENTMIKDGEWNEFELGSVNLGIGRMVLLKVNGEVVFRILDTKEPQVEGSHFGMVDATNGGYVSVRGAE